MIVRRAALLFLAGVSLVVGGRQAAGRRRRWLTYLCHDNSLSE
jgi:hypothetical protein